jgi:hypothetical protein
MRFAAATHAECDHRVMRRCEVAQAVELVRALRDQLQRMTTRLARVEREDVTGRTNRDARMEAAEPRRDIKEAEALIYQLQRRYLNDDGNASRNPQPRRNSPPRAVRHGSGRW